MSKVMSAKRAPGARGPRFRRSEPGQAPFPALVGAGTGPRPPAEAAQHEVRYSVNLCRLSRVFFDERLPALT
jgi:hypothetical protein